MLNAMKIIAVEYTYDDSRLEILQANRPAHRAFLRELFEKGTLLASGPLGENKALIVVRAQDPDAALKILTNDPLLGVEVIASRVAQEWNPVIGPWELEG